MTCSHRPPCPGCPRFGAIGIGRHAAGVLKRLASDADIGVAPLVEGAPLAFRHRARLAVRGRPATPKIGIFQKASHRIADIPRCPIQHPLVNVVAAALKAAMRTHAIAPYADAPHRGLVRYLQVVVERSTDRAQVVLVANDDDPRALAPVAAELEHVLGARLQSLWWNGNPTRTNTILGPHWHRWQGEPAVRETLGGADVFFPPGAFGQSNGEVLDALVATVHAAVPAGARVLELYAGTGTFGLGLAGRGHAVTFNERSADGLAGLERGIEALREGAGATVVVPGPAEDATGGTGSMDVVIADPPRRGLDAGVRDALLAHPPARFVLVSCDVDTLARDVSALGSGPLRLRSLQPVDCFPYTEQVETVAVLDRA